MVNEGKNVIQGSGPKHPWFWKRWPKKEKSGCHFVGRVPGNKVVRSAVSMAAFASTYSGQAGQGAVHLCRCGGHKFASGRMSS